MHRTTWISAVFILCLSAPATGAAQHSAQSVLHESGRNALAGAGALPLWVPAAEMASGAADSHPAILAPARSSSRTSRMLIGTGVGLLTGAAVGGLYGHYQFDAQESFFNRSFETFLFGVMGGSAGGLLGGLAGGFWPDRQQQRRLRS